MNTDKPIPGSKEPNIKHIPFEERGILLSYSVSPFYPERGVEIESNGHHDLEEFLNQVREQLSQKGYKGELAVTTANVSHTTRECRNALDLSMAIEITGKNTGHMPITKLVDVHIPLFGEFAKV